MKTKFLPALLALTLVPACASASPEATLAELEGTSWVLIELAEGEAVPAEPPTTAIFESGRVHGSTGCNNYGAEIVMDEGFRLEVGPTMSTKRGCPPPIMERERAFLERLQAVHGLELIDGRLELHYELEGRAGFFVFEPEE